MEYDKLDEIPSRMSFVVPEAIGNAHSYFEIVGSLLVLQGDSRSVTTLRYATMFRVDRHSQKLRVMYFNRIFNELNFNFQVETQIERVTLRGMLQCSC